MTDRQRCVYIAYTGGTIGMAPSERGYRPRPGFLEEQMNAFSVWRHPDAPRWELHEYDPLLDSSNMTPSDWQKIAEDIVAHYDDFDGFIVLHGTDTMAYSASALSFMLRDLDKPVLFTGSQVPLCELRTDARENLVHSMILAAGCEVPEVCVYIGHRVLRGNRTTKVSSQSYLAFDSPNYGPLIEVGAELVAHRDRFLPRPSGPLGFERMRGPRPRVADVRFFPGITPDTIGQFLQPPIRAAVLHTYGLGNAPDDPAILRAIRDAADRGVVLVNCTQCLHGSVDMSGYATGNSLADAGVISGWDMTPEAALTKLYWLLALDLDVDTVRRRVGESLRGELTRE